MRAQVVCSDLARVVPRADLKKVYLATTEKFRAALALRAQRPSQIAAKELPSSFPRMRWTQVGPGLTRCAALLDTNRG